MILLFSDWVLSKPQGGLLGYQYDNLTRELTVQGDLPEGWTWDILVSASGNSDTWPLALGDGQASITLTDDNLSVHGEYYLQLRGTNGDQVRHTNVITAYNSRSLSGAGQWPILPTEWIQAEKDIKELNAHPPVPGSNGYWLLWDLSSHSYQESDLPVPVGPAGPPNVLEIGTVETLPADKPATASITGESPAQKLNLGIPQGKQGATGNPGAPGKDGQNGVTPTLSAGNVETLEPDQPATASVTGEGPAYQINLGIPRGQTGAQGTPGQNGQTPTIAVGTVTTLDPGQDATAEITGETPNLVLNIGIPQGQPGQDGVQLNDSAINTTEAWSSKKIVDTLCPAFTVEGNPVTCQPVEGYPLGVKVSFSPRQEGEGDPSPENVRPITGYDSVAVNVRGAQLCDVSQMVIGGINGTTGENYSAENRIRVPFIYVVAGQTYTISGYSGLNFSNAHYYDENQNWIGYFTIADKFAVKDGASYVRFTFSKPDQSNFTDSELEQLKRTLMVNFGSTPTPYEPYQPGTTAAITLPEIIYGGTVDAVTGVGEKTWEFLKLNGTEEWNNYTFDGKPGFYCPDLLGKAGENYTRAEGLCNMAMVYVYADSPYTASNYIWCGVNNRSLYWVGAANLLNTPTPSEFKSYLAAQSAAGTPVQVAYKLATPEPFQASGNQALPAVAGLNTVYTDGDSLDVTGRQDLLYTLQTMQAQTQTLNRFIAEGGTQ